MLTAFEDAALKSGSEKITFKGNYSGDVKDLRYISRVKDLV